MGIAPRQIGWSNESNLLWNISKQLDRLTAVMANISPGGGGTNPTSTFVPFNNAGTFADSFLVNETTASVLKTVYSASDIGLKLDFANNQYYLGDFDVIGNGCYFVADNDNSFSQIYSQGYNNLLADGPSTSIGDMSSTGNGTQFGVFDGAQTLIGSANLKSGTAGGASGQYLKILIGGIQYKIALLNN